MLAQQIIYSNNNGWINLKPINLMWPLSIINAIKWYQKKEDWIKKTLDTDMLLDAVTSLIDAFKQAGYNSPTSIQVDKRAFDKLLEEASKLYSSINVKNSIETMNFH